MSKFVIAVFPTEAQAYEGTRAFKDLQADGSLTVYAMAVVTKAADGTWAVKEATDRGPLGTGVGSLVGGLIGLLGGPSGVVLGLATGTLLGSAGDLFNLGVGRDFVDEVSRDLTPGKSAVVAEVEEEWVIPLDTRMAAIGGTVLRQQRGDFEDAQIRQDVAASEADMKALRAEDRRATAEDKAKLKTRIAAAQARLSATAARAKAKRERLRQEIEARVKVLEEHRAKANADAQVWHDRRIAELRADYARRAAELDKTAELMGEAYVL